MLIAALLTMCDEDDGEGMVYECGASLAANAFPNFEEIRRAGKLCDVILVAGSVRFVEKICFLITCAYRFSVLVIFRKYFQ